MSSGDGGNSSGYQLLKAPDVCTYVDDLEERQSGSKENVFTQAEHSGTENSISGAKNYEDNTEDESRVSTLSANDKKPQGAACFNPEEVQIRALRREAHNLKERLKCVMCRNAKAEVTFLPCGHLIACSACADPCHICPRCNRDVLAEVKTYLA